MMVGDEFYINAFRLLSTERQIGMELGEIPWSKIVEYGCRAGLDQDMVDALVFIIREMDGAYLDWMQKEASKARQGSTNNRGSADNSSAG